MTRASSPDVVLIVSAVAATSTLCETSPTTKLRSTVMRAPATKSFPVFLSVLKPDCSATTLYTPTGRSLATKYPLKSVVVRLSSFVSSLTMVIFTPATEPPCESVTVPAIRPKMLWAEAVSTIQTVHKTANISHTVFNTSLRNSPSQTSWFDPDSFVLTRTPLEKIEISTSCHSSWPASFFLPTSFPLGRQRKISGGLWLNALRTALRDGISLILSEKSPAFTGRRQQIRLARCLAQFRAARLCTPPLRRARSRRASL